MCSFSDDGSAAPLVDAEHAACHRTTILRAILSGELPALRLGAHGDYRIPREALEQWLRPTNPEETP